MVIYFVFLSFALKARQHEKSFRVDDTELPRLTTRCVMTDEHNMELDLRGPLTNYHSQKIGEIGVENITRKSLTIIANFIATSCD